MILLTVKPSTSGTGYGICMVMQNVGLSIFPNVVGLITFKDLGTNKYVWVQIVLSGFAVLGLLTSIWLLIIDGKYIPIKLNAKIKDEIIDTENEHETDEVKLLTESKFEDQKHND